MKETMAALNCFKHRSSALFRVFRQLPTEVSREIQEPEQNNKATYKNDDHNNLNGVNALIDRMGKIYETQLTFNEEVSTLLVQIGKKREMHFFIYVTNAVY